MTNSSKNPSRPLFYGVLTTLALLALSFSPALRAQIAQDATIELTLTEGTMFGAVASPDRRLIAIDLLGALWVLPFSGGEAKKITPDTIEARRPSWGPDSRSLAFEAYDDGWHVYTIGVDGSGLRQVTRGPFDDREPDWSRDGRRIAFSSDRIGGFSSIWEVDVDSGAIHLLSAFSGNDPCWSASDREVVFWGRPANQLVRPGLWVAGPDGPERPFAISLAGTNGQLNGPSLPLIEPLSPCGSGRTLGVSAPPVPADEDVFPMPMQWIRPGELLYTADGHIKIRGSRGPSAVVPFKATLKFRRPTYQRTRRDFESNSPQQALGIANPAVSPDGTKIAFYGPRRSRARSGRSTADSRHGRCVCRARSRLVA